jgi:hypothetical protein
VLGAPYPAGTGSELIDTKTIRQVTFSGNSSIIIPDGSIAVSDPIDFPIGAQSELAISIYLKDGQNSSIITSHPSARRNSYYGMGNQVNNHNITGDNVVMQQHWFFISGLEVWSPPSTSAFYIIGDSITDGRGSWNNGNNKWTDNLIARMQKNPATSNIAVCNQAAGGNRVLSDGNGPNAMGRVERDVIAQSAAKYAMIFEGVNDIGTAGLDDASQELVYQVSVALLQRVEPETNRCDSVSFKHTSKWSLGCTHPVSPSLPQQSHQVCCLLPRLPFMFFTDPCSRRSKRNSRNIHTTSSSRNSAACKRLHPHVRDIRCSV